METVLAGDIGGTHARLAVFQVEGGDWRIRASKTYPSRDFAALEDVLRAFLAESGVRPQAACLGIAGVLRGHRAEMVNLPWKPDVLRLASELGLPRVRFLNDLEAAAWGVSMLGPEGQEVLREGEAGAEGNRCLISAGTGLGEAGMIRTAAGFLPFRSEGGHAGFAPRTALEIDLLRHLMERHGHVSRERILSGPGLANVYAFLRDTGRGSEPAWLAERIRAGSPGRVITDCALSGESELCSDALDLFIGVYGGAAADLALGIMAEGGVWLGGGIAPRILSRLKGPLFAEAWLDKGRLRPLLERIPVRVVTDDRLALLGAARAALETA